MYKQLTERARTILALAGQEARAFNHEYIGTEHLLLALMAEDSGSASDVLRSLGVDIAAVRREIDRLIARGPTTVTAKETPLTPRARAAIEYAQDESRNVGQRLADAEHLLLGLLRETDGVAGQVLRNLGVKPDELRAEALKTRIALMKIVERSVRPVHASTLRKRKMREELLAHLTAIYEEGLTRQNDRAAAFDGAARRFGDPSELAQELQAALPHHERISHFVERFVQYRAPESAAKFSLRMAVHTCVLLSIVLGIVQLGIFLRYGWIDEVKNLGRVFGAIVVFTPLAQFVVWLAYIKMRDALWGAFGSRKSVLRAVAFAAAIAVMVQLYLMGVAAVARLDFGVAIEAAGWSGLVAAIGAIASGILAHVSGPGEIRDTKWALLDIEAA